MPTYDYTYTFQEMKMMTRRLINDLRGKPIDDPSIGEAVNTGAQWLAANGMCYEKEADINFVTEVQYADLPSDYIDVEGFAVNFSDSGQDYQSIEIIFDMRFLGQKKDEFNASRPTDSTDINPHRVYFHGNSLWLDRKLALSVPNAAKLFYYAFPIIMRNENDVCGIKLPWVELIPQWAASLVALRLDEFEKSISLQNAAMGQLNAMRAKFGKITYRERWKMEQAQNAAGNS